MHFSLLVTAVTRGLAIAAAIVITAVSCALLWKVCCFLGRPLAALGLTEENCNFPDGLEAWDRPAHLFEVQRRVGGAVTALVLFMAAVYEFSSALAEAMLPGGVPLTLGMAVGMVVKGLVEALVAVGCLSILVQAVGLLR